MGRTQAISEATAQKIDSEVRRLVDWGYEEATRIITERRQDLETLAQGLLEYETLTGEEIKGLFEGQRPTREDPSARPPSGPAAALPVIGKKTGGTTEPGAEPSPA
jgi:cell division protease FtsH